jgi:thiamine-phosphate pyrophosphorylase
MRPVVCMITAPMASSADGDDILRRIESAARAGVHLIQIRQPQIHTLALTRLVERACRTVAGSPARVLVNDRMDVALAAGAHGVHLRGDSIGAPRVRSLAPAGFIVGRSVHGKEEALAVERDGGLDYLLFGTVFASRSKPEVVPAGVDRLAAVCAAVALPVLAIGGLSAASVQSVAGAGAAGFAAIGLFNSGPIGRLPAVIADVTAAFDSPAGLS